MGSLFSMELVLPKITHDIGGLCDVDEGMGVRFPDDPLDICQFIAGNYRNQHVSPFRREGAFSVQHRDASDQIGEEIFLNLVPPFGDDHQGELDMAGVNGVHQFPRDKDGEHGIQGKLPVEDKAGDEDDNGVHERDEQAEGHLPLLAQHHANHVKTAGGGAGSEDEAHGRANNHPAEDGGEDGVVGDPSLGNHLHADGGDGDRDKSVKDKLFAEPQIAQDDDGDIQQ